MNIFHSELTMPFPSLAGRIRITAFDALDVPIARMMYGEPTVYGGYIPIIDDAAERASAGIRKIVAEQYEAYGRLEACWTMLYSEDGALTEAFENRSESSPRTRGMSAMLLQRLRWVAAGQAL